MDTDTSDATVKEGRAAERVLNALAETRVREEAVKARRAWVRKVLANIVTVKGG